MSKVDNLTKIYDRFVLEDRIEDILITKLDMNNFLTPDYQLAENPGMLKKIHKYLGSGQLDEVLQGEGNTHYIDVTYAEEEYRVGTTQGCFKYYDEEAMTDPKAIETGIDALGKKFVNDLTEKAIAEMDKSLNLCPITAWNFDAFVDGVAKFPEEEENLFCLINPAQQAALRKNLKDDLKYVEAFSRKGYIGTVCNVPIYVSNAVPAGRAFMGKRDAVTAFIKKGVESEQARDANTRKNEIYARKVQLVALTNEEHMVVMGANPATACAITTYVKEDPTIAGTCASDAKKVKVWLNGKEVSGVTLSSGSWTVEAEANLAAGDKIVAVSYADGVIPSIDKKTVAA